MYPYGSIIHSLIHSLPILALCCCWCTCCGSCPCCWVKHPQLTLCSHPCLVGCSSFNSPPLPHTLILSINSNKHESIVMGVAPNLSRLSLSSFFILLLFEFAIICCKAVGKDTVLVVSFVRPFFRLFYPPILNPLFFFFFLIGKQKRREQESEREMA